MLRRAVWVCGTLLLLGAVVLPFLITRGIIWFVDPDPRWYPVRGVDVSRHQAEIQWPRVAGAAIRFAYIKATEGGDWRDPRFLENWSGARAAGLVPGAYHFYTFCRPAEEQARNFLALVPVEPRSLPPAIDLEFGGNCARRPAADELVREVRAFAEAVRLRTGREPVLYLTRDFADVYPGVARLPYPLWIRSVYYEPERVIYGRPWTFWQFHSRGRLPGVRGPIDLNVYAGSARAFEAFLKE